MKIDILEDTERRIKIAAKALRHIRNAGNLRVAIGLVGHITAKHRDVALLNNANARDQPQQRRFTDAVRTDHSDHPASGNFDTHIVECCNSPITMGYTLDLSYDAIHH